MANPEHLAKLKEGVETWNQWREANPEIKVDLIEADLREANLAKTNLKEADLSRANLRGSKLFGAYLFKATLIATNLVDTDLSRTVLVEANLCGADLHGAYLRKANIERADLSEVDLRRASLIDATLTKTNLHKADLSGADLITANLREARFIEANLCGADLSGSVLRDADLTGANLSGANLLGADLVRSNFSVADLTGANLSGTLSIRTSFQGANLTGCNVYGVSVWDTQLDGAIQSNLVVAPPNSELSIRVDNIEVAQFIYLLLNNERIRNVIDTITSKVVLILGRFTPERKAVLDAIRDELRKRDYLPILFDFQKPESKDLTGTVTTLANMARFVIADLTEPSSVPHELATIAPGTIVPIQTILLSGQREYAMFPDLRRRYSWVLEPYQYESEKTLLADLTQRVIAPAEAKVIELRQK